MGELDGLVVAITGAGSGIGQALARGFMSDGASVVGCDLPPNVGAAQEVCDLVLAADVTRPEELDTWAQAAVERFGRIDARWQMLVSPDEALWRTPTNPMSRLSTGSTSSGY